MRTMPAENVSSRRGAIAPLTCVMLVFLLGMVAFAVDLSWIVLTKSELQNAADSAALAGAGRLGENFVLYNLPNQTATTKTNLMSAAVAEAKTYATTFASLNSAGAVNNLTLLAADIDVGFTSSSGVFTSYTSDNTKYPNTVNVTMRRDASANTSLGLFFAPVFGISKTDVTATASSTLYTSVIDSYKVGSVNSGMLPVTFDVNDWNEFIKSGQDSNGTTNKDSSGYPVLEVYPSIKDKGNFGLLSLNDSHVGANTISGWINNGVPSSDIQTLIFNGLIPLSKHTSAWDWQGENGFKASNVMDINAYVGKIFVLPLFTPKDPSTTSYSAGKGQGSNYNYNIVQFVGVKIMQAPSNNKQVWIQPAAISDPNMILTTASTVPLGTSSTFSTIIVPAKLTN